MRTKLCLIVLALTVFFSCKKDSIKNTTKTKGNISTTDSVTLKADTAFVLNYNISYNAWLAFKQTVNNSYTYTIVTAYVESAINLTELKTTVKNGQITARDYTEYAYAFQNAAKKVIMNQWHEQGVTLNTHPEVGEPMTLDDIYLKAKNSWLNADPVKNDIYFETRNSGLISQAGYYPKGCQDNCFIGIQQLSSITSL
jgi:hypothetical protein